MEENNFVINLKCEGYGFSVEIDKKNIITKDSDLLCLDFSYEELNLIINTLNDLKFIRDYNKRKE